MNNNLLAKLAFTGLKNNKKTVLPFILVSSVTVMIFHILLSLTDSKYIIQNGHPVFKGADLIVRFLAIGCFAVAVFAIFFLFYGNRFVMRGWKKEMGLYGVLGLSKKNVTIVLLIENLIQAGSVMGLGILGGAFLNKLVVLFLYKLVRQPIVKGMDFSLRATIVTLVYFSVLFAVIFIFNLFEIRLGNPISLLKSENLGEKEPKVKWVLLIIGVISLVLGYYKALSTVNTFSAMGNLINAIALVSVATYALFVTGSIFVLKMLKKNKNYYFKTRHFISVSNLMFRMKHNAVGLASICILSTGVILLLVCSSSLMMLGESNINMMYKRDALIWSESDDSKDMDYYLQTLDEAVAAGNVDAENKTFRHFSTGLCKSTGNGIVAVERSDFDFSKMRECFFMTVEEYNLYTGENESLEKGEILRYSSIDKVDDGDKLSLLGNEYVVKKKINKDFFEEAFQPSMILFDKEIFIVSDEAEREVLTTSEADMHTFYETNYLGFDYNDKLSGEQYSAIRDSISQKMENTEISFKEEEKDTFYSMYGGAFFVGVFLASLFLLATVMIIFYKQLSEGMEDKKRFEILSNAGLSDKEAKGVIRDQVMIMFFMPAITAIIHMLFASKILRLFMGMILIVDTATFNIAIAAVSAVFLGVYAIVYSITSKQYYNIVYGKNEV